MSTRGIRRAAITLLAVLVFATAGAGTFWLANRPRPDGAWSGDEQLVTALGSPEGLHQAAVVVVERGKEPRFAGLGSTTDRPFEIGSVSKTFLGLLLTDAAAHGVLSPDDPLDRWLPELSGTPAGGIRLRELATHTGGLPHEGEGSDIGTCWYVGSGCLTASQQQLVDELRHARIEGRGEVRYSNLGAAAAGVALSRAAGQPYPALVRDRLTAPLGMTHTRAQTPDTGALAPTGHQPRGTRPGNLVMDGYTPAGGFVSTSGDLAAYLAAALDGQVPLDKTVVHGTPWPGAPTVGGITQVQSGCFWFTGTLDGQRVAFHTGETPGYRAVIMIDLARGRAVAVLSDVNTPLGDRAVRALHAS